MATRRSRKQIHTITNPKITGDIPVYLITDPEGVRFEIDLTVPKLSPRLPFCKVGDAIPALIEEAQNFIDVFTTLTWAKHVFIAATPILNADGVGIEIVTGVIEHTTWPGAKPGDAGVEMWRTATTPWETRSTPLPSDFKHSSVQVLPWSPEIEDGAAMFVNKVRSFSQGIISGLASAQTAMAMITPSSKQA